MSQAKREMEREHDRRHYVHKILIDAKIAQPCPAHGFLVYLEQDPTPADKLGNYRLQRDAELRALFDTSRELTDAIKSAFHEEVSDVCPFGDCSWRGA